VALQFSSLEFADCIDFDNTPQALELHDIGPTPEKAKTRDLLKKEVSAKRLTLRPVETEGCPHLVET
jgi:hypothetical protein